MHTVSRAFAGITDVPPADKLEPGRRDELSTRVIPIEPAECAYARNRPPDERTSIPKVGDPVYYRHYEWAPDVDRAVVVEVQDLNEQHDPNLWHLVRDRHGRPLFVDSQPRLVRVADPWPWVVVLTENYGYRTTWESRVRGSAGWLPLNWRDRPTRLAHELIMYPHQPLYVPESG